jgi:hypothetical protein
MKGLKIPQQRRPHINIRTGTQYYPFPMFNFTGGLNTKEAVTMIGDNESPDLLNVSFDITGSMVKRNGYQRYIQTSIGNSPVDGLRFFKQSNGNVYVMASSGGYLWAWYNNTWNQLDSIGAYPNFEVYYDTFYAVDGNKFIQFDGTMTQVVAGAPNGKYIKLLKNRLFLAGDPLNPNRLYFSDLGNPSSWPSLNFIDVNTNDGDFITGLAVFLDQLIVFKSNSTWALFVDGQPSSWVFRCINPEYGTVSHRSVSVLGNTLMFLGHAGVYALHMTRVQNYMNIELMSYKIEPNILALTHPELAQAATHKNRYWLSCPKDGVTYVYDLILQSWTKYDISASSLWEQDGNLYSGSASTGLVYQQDTGLDDDGVAINAYYKTKYYDMGIPERQKKLKRIIVFGERYISNSSVTVSIGTDFSPTTTNFVVNLIPAKNSLWGSFVWGTDPWGGVTGEQVQKISLSKIARYVQVTIGNNTLDQPFTVRGFTILFKPKALR